MPSNTISSPIKSYLSLVKFSHTIFALPFAMVGFTLGVLQTDSINWGTFVLVVLCMVFARSAAMAFNRYLDRDIDEKNPRTKVREIPAGVISPRSALVFVIVNSFLFTVCAGLINSLCLVLSPIALLVVLGYSYTKRFTAWCHFVLGLGLALAPVGAYIAVTGEFSLLSVLYGLVVLFWVAGFDIIYALQDEGFDAGLGLHSIPVALGKKGALQLSNALHIICGAILLIAINMQMNSFEVFTYVQWIAAAIFLGLLIYQHTLVSQNNLSKVNLAFFTTNGIASVVFGVLIIVDAFLV